MVDGASEEYFNNIFGDENGNVTMATIFDSKDDEFSDSISSSSERFVNNLSDAQEIFLSWIGFPSALLSLTGSALIIYLISREKKYTPYRRIMLALSTCDIFASIATIADPFLLPKGSSGPWAVGNDATCSLSGFIWQFSLSSLWYNGGLSFYFLATVRFGMKPEKYAFPYEALSHFISLSFALTTSIHGLIIGIYGPILGTSCWVANDYPEGCVDMAARTDDDDDDDVDIFDTDIVPCKTPTIAWIYGGLPFLIVFLALCVNNLVIYCFVKRTIMRSMKNSAVRSLTHHELESDETMKGDANFDHRNTTAVTSTSTTAAATTTTNSIWKAQMNRLNAVRTQSLLYVGAFMITYIWTLIRGIVEMYAVVNADQWMPLLVLNSIFYPMQGFFNFFVYIRPKYLFNRDTNKSLNRMQLLRVTLFGGSASSANTSV